jgi:DNA (cytosine-5)-methyltransferase 1
VNSRVDFCGAGGSTIGLVDAGYDAPGYDHWKVAVDTCVANAHRAYVWDLSLTDPPVPPRPWFYWASPPCQPFSAAGDGGGEDDARDGIPWWLRILGNQLPEVAIMENVRGLTFEKHSAYLARVLRQVHDLGYRYEWRILNSADYGVPQTRERFFLIARRDGGPIVWPTVTHTEQAGMFTERWVSMADALGWAGPVWERQANGGRRDATEPSLTVTASLDNGNLRRLVDTRTLRGTIDAEREPAATITVKTSGQWRKNVHLRDEAEWPHERPATTIHSLGVVSAPGWHDPTISGSQQADAIPVTIDELARLQDFPDGYQFCGTKTDKARQIGNAVPPTMARLLAAANRPMALEVAA